MQVDDWRMSSKNSQCLQGAQRLLRVWPNTTTDVDTSEAVTFHSHQDSGSIIWYYPFSMMIWFKFWYPLECLNFFIKYLWRFSERCFKVVLRLYSSLSFPNSPPSFFLIYFPKYWTVCFYKSFFYRKVSLKYHINFLKFILVNTQLIMC